MLSRNKKAMMGVGVLLIFIATILTSAIAAGVLLRTSGTLQQKTVEVEKTTRERLTTGIEFYRMNAFANTTAGTVEEFEILTRLKPGSSPVSMTDTKIFLIGEDFEAEYSYIANVSLSGSNLLCDFGNLTSEYDYCLEYIFGNSNSVVEEEELGILKLKVNDTHALAANEYVTFQMIPKVGEIEEVTVRIPSLKTSKVQIY